MSVLDIGWLIELDGVPNLDFYYVVLVPEDTHPGLGWTVDPNEALRFARKRDAEAFTATFLSGVPVRTVEHAWA